MHFGASMFFTDYSMSAPALARALEERGFRLDGYGVFFDVVVISSTASAQTS